MYGFHEGLCVTRSIWHQRQENFIAGGCATSESFETCKGKCLHLGRGRQRPSAVTPTTSAARVHHHTQKESRVAAAIVAVGGNGGGGGAGDSGGHGRVTGGGGG